MIDIVWLRLPPLAALRWRYKAQRETMVAYCLADFFNLSLWPRGREPTYADIRGGLEDLVAASLQAAGLTGKAMSELLLRLYGGWYGDKLDTRVPVRDLAEAVIRDFPRGGSTRLRLHLAETPIWKPSLRLLRTYRTTQMRAPGGTPRTPTVCPHYGACSIPALASWLKGRCPDTSCAAKFRDLGSTSRQKMVDTLLTADALTVVREELADALIIASDDDDVIPVLLAATQSSLPVVRMRRDSTPDAYYDGILELEGLLTHTW